ncbi:MAG TPA: hypothetical protein VGB81_15815 [Devosia sp.]
MLKAIKAWREKRRRAVPCEVIGVFDEQLLADLGLTWEDVREARAKRADSGTEGAVFP